MINPKKSHQNLKKAGTKLRAKIWKKTMGLCWYCGIQTIPWENFCVDHFENEGGDEEENLVPSCSYCNRLKTNHHIADFVEFYEFTGDAQ